jgi:hypothetical protein
MEWYTILGLALLELTVAIAIIWWTKSRKSVSPIEDKELSYNKVSINLLTWEQNTFEDDDL